jgi:hypothetical protein
VSDAAAELPVTFHSFIVSLAASVMMHLGEAPNPETGATDKNLTLARNSYAMLQLLKAKTRGNLDEQERELMDALLDELGKKLEAAV